MKDRVFYHGNENKVHRFSEIAPSFFSEDFKYSLGYGDHVKAYRINTEKPFDPATDEVARKYYNEVFLNDELGSNAKELKPGENIGANDADNFWAFITVEEMLGNGFGYDSMVVREFEKDMPEYDTRLSFVPFNNNQIEPISSLDFESIPESPRLDDFEAELFFESIGEFTRGKCLSLATYLAKEEIGELMIVKSSDSNEILHGFVKSKNGLSVDGGGIMPVYEMLGRYIDCVPNGDYSNFNIKSISIKDLLKQVKISKEDIENAKQFWELATKEFNKEIGGLLGPNVQKRRSKEQDFSF